MMFRRAVLALGVGIGTLLVTTNVASAHPLGNFTINQASVLEVGGNRLAITHVVDMAEIPTFQTKSDIDRDRNGDLSGAERRQWAQAECGRVNAKLSVQVDGARAKLNSGSATAVLLAGQAGLQTLRLECKLSAPLAAGVQHRVRFSNGYVSDRIGWREITAVGDGARLVGRSVPRVSPSALLTKYPTDRLSSPLDQRSVSFESRPSGAQTSAPVRTIPTATGSVVRGFDSLTQSLTDSVSARRLTVGLALVALAFAIALGALHAFAPGHGKTVMAAYLVGERGTVKDGLLIGVTVATTHTLGVLILGAVLTASQTFAPESVYPYLSLASGVCFAFLGVFLLVGAIRRRKTGGLRFGHHHHGPGGHTHEVGHDHSHVPEPERALALAGVPAAGHAGNLHTAAHDDHHAHAHAHDSHEGHDDHDGAPHVHDDHGHSHRAPAVTRERQLSRRSLLTLGFAGGLVPTPTAVVVLLGATAIGRAWFGAVLVLAYGIGMGGTLVLAGLVLAKARRRFDLAGRSDRALRIAAFFPVATAVVITASGLWLVARAAIAF